MLLGRIGSRTGYESVYIRVFPRPSGSPAPGLSERYRAELTLTNGPSFPDIELQINLGDLLATSHDPAAYGMALGRMVFANQALGQAYGETVAATLSHGGRLEVRLHIEPPELQELHWERIFHPLAGKWQPMGSTANTALSRYLTTQRWGRPRPLTERPLRMLAVIASPADLNSYGLDPIGQQEIDALRALLDGLPDVAVTYLASGTAAPASLNNLRTVLAQQFHLVHILCHGAQTKKGTVLYLETDTGTVAPVETSRLVQATSALAEPPAFCLLAACETAARSARDAFVPLGPALVQDGGLQAVIAMSEKVGIATAQRFSAQFYDRLLAHGVVDRATNEARAAIQDEWDWGAPVLFSRLPDNQIIDFPEGSIYAGHLARGEHAASTIHSAMAAARSNNQGLALIAGLEQITTELSKSYELLADIADPFIEVGSDPAAFARRFARFSTKFKSMYRKKTWVEEKASCRKILQLRAAIMPELRSLRLLDDATLDELDNELRDLSGSDDSVVWGFQTYLEDMNRAVDSIRAQIDAGNLKEAIRLKLAFDDHITPSLNRSRDALDKMSDSITRVAKA